MNCLRKKLFCQTRNDTVLGHYESNPISGAKICHIGWAGENCTEGKLVRVTTISLKILLEWTILIL